MNGLMTTTSEFSVAETMDRMVLIIEQAGWHLFARIDHAGQARNKGLELRPTELILFGNPGIGTRLMQDHQPAAIDLPMKVLVWEDVQSQVRIAHNTMAWLRDRHELTDQVTLNVIDALLTKVRAGGRSRDNDSTDTVV